MTAPDMVSVIAKVIAGNSVVIHDGPERGELTAITITPDEMARAVLVAISEAGQVEWGVLLGDLNQPHASQSEADARRDSECACCTLATRITGPWTAVEG